jgi:hypothetical protein
MEHFSFDARDLFLSNTVRMHPKLCQSDVRAELLVFEAQSHAQYLIVPDAGLTGPRWRAVPFVYARCGLASHANAAASDESVSGTNTMTVPPHVALPRSTVREINVANPAEQAITIAP